MTSQEKRVISQKGSPRTLFSLPIFSLNATWTTVTWCIRRSLRFTALHSGKKKVERIRRIPYHGIAALSAFWIEEGNQVNTCSLGQVNFFLSECRQLVHRRRVWVTYHKQKLANAWWTLKADRPRLQTHTQLSRTGSAHLLPRPTSGCLPKKDINITLSEGKDLFSF